MLANEEYPWHQCRLTSMTVDCGRHRPDIQIGLDSSARLDEDGLYKGSGVQADQGCGITDHAEKEGGMDSLF